MLKETCVESEIVNASLISVPSFPFLVLVRTDEQISIALISPILLNIIYLQLS